jgi:hypothetical protein
MTRMYAIKDHTGARYARDHAAAAFVDFGTAAGL